MERRYDVVVVGSGPAGGAAAMALRKAGRSVALVEKLDFGGVCPMRGCNPKKVLMGPAEARVMASHLQGKGLGAAPDIHWGQAMAFTRTFLDGKPERIEKAYADKGVDTLHGAARFLSPETLALGQEVLRFDHCVLAVGRIPQPLKVSGAALVASSDDFLELTVLPKRLVFIGGGFISFEFAHMAVQAGSQVTIIHRGARPLKGFEPSLVDKLVESSRAMGVDIRLGLPLHSVERHGAGFLVRAGEQGEVRLEADLVVHGAGRVADVAGLDLEAGGVSLDKGGIAVDTYLRNPGNPRVYAVGDAAATGYALTPTGSREGALAARNILEGDVEELALSGVARVVFTLPPLAAVGLTTAEAQGRSLSVRRLDHDLTRWFPWQRLGETAGAAVLLLDEARDVLVGGHVFGHAAEELANLLALVIALELPRKELKKVLWAYPTCGYYLQYLIDE